MAMKSKSARETESTQLDLRGSRMKQGLSLEQIAETTKISIRFLRAIEAEEFKELPGGIFSTSYLKQYAAAVKFDEEKLLSFYEREIAPVPSVNVHSNGSSQRGLLRWFRVPAAAGR
jgi:cytoskeleton protein RodZ